MAAAFSTLDSAPGFLEIKWKKELVKELVAAGMTMLDEIEVFPYGKFVHFLDPEDNKIELWEPVEIAAH